jgi:leader peptidase (prepilin peptidase)/N-methyltransferase
VYWLAASGLVLGTFVDFEHLIIPDRVTLGGIAAGTALSALLPGLHGETSRLAGLMWSLTGAALGWGLLWLVAIAGRVAFRREAMGFGDVKLLGAIGAFLGWRAVLFSIVASSLAGSLVGLALVAGGRKHMRSRIPYGPFLALAAVTWILWGPTLCAAYLRILAPMSVGSF